MVRIMKALNRLLGPKGSPEDAIHFLHVGKAAGTQIKHLAEQSDEQIIVHRHDTRLRDIPRSAPYFFSIRNPVSRFYSGFYSRKRKGRPVYDVPWTKCEAVAFRDFDHANDLAEALFEPGERGVQATQAMISIRHTGQNLVSWFFLQGNIFEVWPPLWIIRQEQFEQDFDEFLNRAGLERPAAPPADRLHANDYSDTPPLSELAKEKLRRWYAQDFAFYDACESWLAMQDPSTGETVVRAG